MDDIENVVFDLVKETVQEVLQYYSMPEAYGEEYSINLIDVIQQVLEVYVLINGCIDGDDEVLNTLKTLAQAMINEEESKIVIRRKGRPEILIDKDQLRYLVEQGFSVKHISLMFNCSRRTIERRMAEFEISLHKYSLLSDDYLDGITREIVALFPRCGENLLIGRLRSSGIVIQRERVRESLRRVDPTGVMARCRGRLHRRQYSVPSANALWHIDGYHKLIRWGYVIHGGIDGFSRLITFLNVSTNNLSNTVLHHFLKGVEEFGLPLRIRTDRGGENVAVASYMMNHPSRGPDSGCVITGRSTHNQRIERLWRDLFSGCVSFFYYFFYYLEQLELLDVNSPLDLWALHLAFTPIIQHHLDIFRLGWAHHKLRTEGNLSPMQLWIEGLQLTDESLSTANDWCYFGVDWEGPISLDDDCSIVHVQELPFQLNANQQELLKNLLLPLKSSENFSQSAMVAQFAIVKSFVANINVE